MATGNKLRFVESGAPTRVAVELAKQITASTGNARALKELGVHPVLADYIAKSVVSHTASTSKLTEMGWPARMVTEFIAQIKS